MRTVVVTKLSGAKAVTVPGTCLPSCECRNEDGYYGVVNDSKGCMHTTVQCNKPGMELSALTGE